MLPSKPILTVSRDRTLQLSRTLLLEDAGFSVIELSTDLSVASFLALRSHPELALVLMCHSVPEKSRLAMCAVIKRVYPETPILMLYNGNDPTLARVDARLENMWNPQALVETIGVLLSGAAAN